jgi:hypothetical protein
MHPEDKKQPHGKQQTLKLQLSANLCTPREAAAPTLTTEQLKPNGTENSRAAAVFQPG